MASSMTPAADGNQESNVEVNATLDSEGTSSSSAIRMNRKRTKTGCLTCRKRRIKCDESKPSCRNCIKSKRHCEGYNQRVMFKPPAFDYQPTSNGSAHITFQAGPIPGPAMVFPNQMSGFETNPSMFTQYPPRALEQFVPGHLPVDTTLLQYQPQMPQFSVGSEQQLAQNLLDSTSVSTASFSHGLYTHDHIAQSNVMPNATQFKTLPETQAQIDQSVPRASQNFHITVPGAAQASALWNNEMLLHREASNRAYGNHVTAPIGGAASQGVPQLITGSKNPVAAGPQALPPRGEHVPKPQLMHLNNQQALPPAIAESQRAAYTETDKYDHDIYQNALLTPNFVLTQGAIQTLDDDYWDVDSDDEREQEKCAIVPRNTDHHHVLSQILELNQISIQEQQARRYDTFIHHGMLDHYKLEWVANPLKNAATARIFAHFIAVTGPSLSIFERQPRNTSVLFTEGHIPFSQQGLWTYTMPMAALHNQGLLHAMLAIASLHIARLTGASITPSLQHYVWATKRVHPDVGHPRKRLQAATIGASMLLGFYEIMTADHIRWNTHLAGSSKLFIETDFADMTRRVKRMKQNEQFKAPTMTLSSVDAKEQIKDEILGQIFDVDERMISEFVGKEVRYEDHGRVMDDHTDKEKPLDLVEFGTVKDLYWWYCKQDVYQAILSGDGLLMGFDRWANCPPRAPLGKPDAVYGSFDHLMILLARVADFSARDRARKLKQMEANGGHWIPAQAMNITRANQQTQPSGSLATEGPQVHTSSAQRPMGAPPPSTDPTFYGMAPAPRTNVRPPAPYGHFDSPPNSHTSSMDDSIHLQEATRNALAEYGRIRAALHTFSVSLGDYYKPLAQEYQVSLETPFGPALFYRSYDISCLWAVWHMAVIIAIRSHPHMPPAAHMAAAVAKKETAYSANEIGRIVAGIVPSPVDQPLNPSLGAALCESCMPSFFAAVQYDDAEQRHFTVTRIYSIAQRTGWGSVELIANGCETAWVKGAARGGPPYVRVARPQASDDPRLNGSWEQLDPRQRPNDTDQSDRRLVHQRADARVNWAIGVMGTEEDVKMTG